jgi:RimJ/RimL family protein N-acetyltransferase
MTILLTPRLRLEPFDDAHFDGLYAMNSQPEVMRYITGRPETEEETRAAIARVKARWAEWGYSWWAFIERATGALVGAGAIQHLNRDASAPLEIGWRLPPAQWGKGLASEAAEHMAAFAFDALKPAELLAVCDPDNTASARVMQRLGMRYRGLELWYEHDCATYVVTADEWRARAQRGGSASSNV